MELPARAAYVIVGAGIHGLSTGYHLAKELEARGLGAGSDIVVLDKHSPGRAPPASPAASFATTTSSRRCRS